MFNRSEYINFIANKSKSAQSTGFEANHEWTGLFEHQKKALDFCLEKGRGACFFDTGLGKSRIEGATAFEFSEKTNKPSLILTPLAIGPQMARECNDLGFDATIIKSDDDVKNGVNICNYEKIGKLDLSRFGGVVLDESSILKSFNGRIKNDLIRFFKETDYKLAATATPSPNDHMELGNHSDFLGYMNSMEMLCRWFINDTSKASQEWRLKGHSVGDFWRWIASWARAASLPSDMGGCDDGYILPPIDYSIHQVKSDLTKDADEGMLFRIPDNSATNIHKEKRLTLNERCETASHIANQSNNPFIVWCETNDEQALLEKLIPDAVSVHGSQTTEKKEYLIDQFSNGSARVIIGKPKMLGFGLNWQHCHEMCFASLSHSYEQFYQAVRRVHRFGQSKQVKCHVVMSDTEQSIWKNILTKMDKHAEMKRSMSDAMVKAQNSVSKRKYNKAQKIELPSFMKG